MSFCLNLTIDRFIANKAYEDDDDANGDMNDDQLNHRKTSMTVQTITDHSNIPP